MSYIEKRLFEGEHIGYRGDFHWMQKAEPWLWLIFLGWFVIGIYFFVKRLVRLKTTEFVVTNRRVIFKEGFFKTRMEELELDAIEGAHTTQNFYGRMFGYGNVYVNGRGEGQLDLPVMRKPGQFVAAAEKARMQAEQAPFDVISEQIAAE